MFGNSVSSGLTFTKVLGGISKTLSIANQVIPLYREAKPMINNAKTIMSVLKGMGGNKNVAPKKEEIKTQPIKKNTPRIPESNTNNPKFFL